MVQLFRLRRSSLRLKIPLLTLLSLIITIFGIGISAGITSGAPIFTAPVTAAQGRQLNDISLKIRNDGLAFLVGTSFTVTPSNAHIRNVLSLTVLNNGNSYTDSVNADAYGDDIPVKYPYIAFSSVDNTGYIVWRTQHSNPQGFSFETYIRVIPPAYNGVTNKTLGPQVRLYDHIGYQFDQPSIAVDSVGNLNIIGYAATTPVQLRLVTLDKNFNLISQATLDSQPGGERAELEPIICMDPTNNVHVVSQMPYGTASDSPVREYAYSRVSPSNSFVKTDITPPGWRELKGHKAKDITCAPDGTVYAAINNTGQYDLFKRTAGAGGSEKWSLVHPNVFQIYASAVAVTTSTDGRLWAAQADGKNSAGDPNPNYGANVKFSTDGGITFSSNERALPANANQNISVAIDGNGPGGKVHLISSFQFGYDSYTTQYAWATTIQTLPAPANLTATAVSQTQINLSWTAPGPGADTYRVYRATSPVGPYTQIGTISGPTTTFQDTGLTFGTAYYYDVNAIKNGYNNSPDSNIASAVTFGPVALVFTNSPNSGTAGAPLNPSPTVKVVDQVGNTVTGFNGSVTFSIEPGTGAPNANLGGSTTQNIVNGVSSFSGSPLTIDRIGGGFQLRATSGSLTGTSNPPFNQTGTLAIGSLSGLTATTPFTVTVDVNKTGGKDTNYNGPVYLSFNSANGAYYYGQTAVLAVGGTATFHYQMIDTQGSGYFYIASLPGGLGSGPSGSFSVAPYPSLRPCTRYMVTNAVTVGTDVPCSQTDLNLALALATGQNPKVPVYIDHRATGLGATQVSYNSPVTIPDGAILDGGCSGSNTQGLLLKGGFSFTGTGNNLYLRGIYFQGKTGAALFKPDKGNTMSCDKVQVTP